jgi:hypothetical protein
MENQITLPTISVSQSQYEELKEAARHAQMELRDFIAYKLFKPSHLSAKESASPEALYVANEIKEALKEVKDGNVQSYDSIDDAMYAL